MNRKEEALIVEFCLLTFTAICVGCQFGIGVGWAWLVVELYVASFLQEYKDKKGSGE